MVTTTPIRQVPYAGQDDFCTQYPSASQGFAQMYDAEIITTGHGKTPTTPLKSYPVGMSLMTLNAAEGATAGWPASDWATVTTFRRDPTNSYGYQFWNRATTTASSEMWVRNANGDTWAPWTCVIAQTPMWGSYQRTAVQTVPNATTTPVLGSMIASEGGMTYNSSTGEVTVPTNGVYLLTGWATFVANATGIRMGYWYRNATLLVRVSIPGNAQEGTIHVAKVARLVAGEKLTFKVYQTSGVSLDLQSGNVSTGFDIFRLTTLPAT